MRISKLFAGVSAMAIATAVVAGCAGAPPAEEEEPAYTGPGGPLIQRLFADWTSFDPYDPGTVGSNQVMAAVYDRLVLVKDGEVVPYLAESWELTPTSIEFTMRDDATCEDGTPVTPSLVLRNWERLFDPAKPSPNAAQFLGTGPYKLSADDEAGTVSIELNVPRSSAIYAFTASVGSIVCPAGLDDPASLKAAPSGSGPFTVVQALQGDRLELKVRDDWAWGPDGTAATTPGFPQELTYLVVTNDTTAANLIATGDLDVSIVKGLDVARLKADPSLINAQALPYTTDTLQFNQDPNRITSDPTVRLALATAVDPAGWNQAMNAGEGILSSSVVTPNAPCYAPSTEDLAIEPDVDAAREILIDDGWEEGADGKLSKDGQPLAIRLLGTDTQGQGPEYLFEVFNELGATVTLDKIEFANFATKYRTSDFDAVVGNLSFSVPGPMQIFPYLSGPLPTNGGRNFGLIVDDELNDAVDGAQASSGDEQCEFWATAQERLLEEHYVVPMAGQVASVFARLGFAFQPTANNFVEPYSLRAPSAEAE